MAQDDAAEQGGMLIQQTGRPTRSASWASQSRSAGRRRGHRLARSRRDELALAEGWFYTFQLKGCRVYAAGGECLGTITDVLDVGGSEVRKVDSENEETLIPFAQEFLKEIDLGRQRIEVDLPEGLRGLNK